MKEMILFTLVSLLVACKPSSTNTEPVTQNQGQKRDERCMEIQEESFNSGIMAGSYFSSRADTFTLDTNGDANLDFAGGRPAPINDIKWKKEGNKITLTGTYKYDLNLHLCDYCGSECSNQTDSSCVERVCNKCKSDIPEKFGKEITEYKITGAITLIGKDIFLSLEANELQPIEGKEKADISLSIKSLNGLLCKDQHAQNTNINQYRSVNYYKNGITEYIDLISPKGSTNWEGLEIYYFTSKKLEKVKLTILSIKDDCIPNSECTSYIKVSFPKSKTVYTLIHGVEYLASQDASGKKQEFEPLR